MARRQFDQSQTQSAGYNNSPADPTAPLGPDPASQDATPVNGKPKTGRGKRGFWGWQLIWLSVLFGFGTTGAAALLWLLTMPPLPNCQQISPLAADGERLYCAQQAARSGKLDQLLQAISLVQAWPPEHPLREQAQQLTADWSKAILELAQAKVETGDLQGGLDIVAKIPKTSPAYPEVEETVAGWQNNWAEGKQLYDQAQDALKRQDLRKASDYAQALFKLNNVFWGQKRYNELVEQIALERQGWQRLQEAKDLAREETPEQLGEAITLAKKIDAKLYAFTEARKEISRWSRTLLEVAKKRLEQKDLEGALVAASVIPADSEVYAEAQDLMQLGQAQAVTWNQSLSTPPMQHIFALLEGSAAASKIAPGRPLYTKAQTQIQDLQLQFRDLLQLQMASAVANIGQPFALQLAIDQVQMISTQRPRRIHAQTMVAFWRKEILRLEDQPYILLARRAAELETPANLQSAITLASQVNLGRPRRVEAQTLIAQWTKRLQILEDQPLLDQALALAKQNKLNEAVAKASQIQRGRALYDQAQANITQWVAEAQIAQDRPILNEASNLAAQGSLSAAINVASQISYGRALYGEAQSAIARWGAERDAQYAPAPQVESAPVQYAPPPEPAQYAPAPEPQSTPEPEPEQYAPPPEPEQYAPPPEPEYAPPPEPEYIPPPEPEPAPEQYEPPASEAAPEPAPEAAPEPAAEAPPPAEPAPAPDANLLPE